MEEVYTTLFKLNNYIFSLFRSWSIFIRALLESEPSGQVKFPLLKKAILPPLSLGSPLAGPEQTIITSAAIMIKINEAKEKEAKPV